MSVPSDNDQHQNPEPRAWVVRAGRDGETEQHNLDHHVTSIDPGESAVIGQFLDEQYNLDNHVTSIGWGDWLEALEQFTDREDFEEHLDEHFPELGAKRGAREIWCFAREIEVGDLVVMPQKRPELGRRRLIAIGRVIGPYEFDPSQPGDAQQRRKVEWLQTDLPREVVQDDLDKSMNSLGTVYSLEKNDAPYRIKYLAEHGEDPGDRNRSVDNDSPEIWEERLKEYLDYLRTVGRKASTIENKRSILRRWIHHMLEQGLSPVVFDPTLLNAFLDDIRILGEGSRRDYSSHIKSWCENWDVPTSRLSHDSDTRSRQERLAGAAEKLLCETKDLQEIVDLLEDKGQVILYGPPGTGKTYLAQELAEALAPDEQTRSLVQFHPAYSYEDFFEGYRPVTDDVRQMTYELTPGPLAMLAEHAEEYPEQQHVMVIDEINRANLPRVLGELLFLLEYRDKSMAVMHRSDGSFKLPKNLWFIGTMNTADRSIALIDAAMRRRFHFFPFFPRRGPTENLLRKWTSKYAPKQAWVVALVSAVNRELEKELGGDHLQLGPSHFMKQDLNDRGFERVWKYNIEPFIEDQLFGKPDKIKQFRLEAVLDRHGPEHFEESTSLDGPTIPGIEQSELSPITGPSSSGGRVPVSPEMRKTPLVRGLEVRLGNRLRFNPDSVPAGCLQADTVGPRGFSLRTSPSNGSVSLLHMTGNSPNTVYFKPKVDLDRLSSKRREVEDYAKLLLELGEDISQYKGGQKPKLPLDVVLEALDQISECVAALA